jgi:polyferredoxin
VAGGYVENVYRLQIMNATEVDQHFEISVSGLPGLEVTSDRVVKVESTQSRWVVVRLQMPLEAALPGSHPIQFRVEGQEMPMQVSEKSVFMVQH